MGAVATLFTLYSGFLLNENRALKAANDALEKESKKYASIIITAVDSEAGIKDMRNELARLMRGD